MSNLTKVSNFPNQGKDSDTAIWLLQSANVPYPDEELTALQVMCKYIDWDWGQDALLNNKEVVRYLCERSSKAKPILEQKYAVVSKAL